MFQYDQCEYNFCDLVCRCIGVYVDRIGWCGYRLVVGIGLFVFFDYVDWWVLAGYCVGLDLLCVSVGCRSGHCYVCGYFCGGFDDVCVLFCVGAL